MSAPIPPAGSPIPSPAAEGAPSGSALQPCSPSAVLPRLLARFPAAKVELVVNPGPAAEHSLLIAPAQAREIATFLRDDDTLRLDYCSNATGLDWPDREIVDPATKARTVQPGYLEVVYHLYSISRKQGPVILRLRTANRSDQVTLPSLTPVWKSCEFQEREIYDLYGVVFADHPDLRRLLMWDGFTDYPMRRDYVAPDDFEWEPTPHGSVLERAKAHWPAPPQNAAGPGEPGPGPATPAAKRPEAKP